jgi:hypothetical protein
MVNLNPIRELLGPTFRPFNVRLMDERQFGVPHQDFIPIGRGIVSIIDEDDVPHTIDALHIVSVDEADGLASRV